MMMSTTRPDPPSPRVDLAVLVHEFPKLSETFVLAELLALEAAGVRLAIFSVKRPESAIVQEAAAALRARVEYLPVGTGARQRLLERAIKGWLLARDPRRFMRGLVEIYASPDYSALRLREALMLARALDGLGRPPLYVHFAHKPATVGRFASLLLGLPYGISAHAVDVWTPSSDELARKFREATIVLCCYEDAHAYISRLADGRTPVELVYHGVEIPAAAERAPADPPVILSVGRLVEKKGFEILIRAAALLRARGRDFRLRIVGDGPLWASLQRLIGELELDEHVRLAGPRSTGELEPEFARATAFALASVVTSDGNRDGIPNTLLEAMARGLPVVSTTLGGISEAARDGENALLVAPGDPEALASALERVLDDVELAARLGAAARLRAADRFDRAKLAPRVLDALRGSGLLKAPDGL